MSVCNHPYEHYSTFHIEIRYVVLYQCVLTLTNMIFPPTLYFPSDTRSITKQSLCDVSVCTHPNKHDSLCSVISVCTYPNEHYLPSDAVLSLGHAFDHETVWTFTLEFHPPDLCNTNKRFLRSVHIGGSRRKSLSRFSLVNANRHRFYYVVFEIANLI